MKIRCGDCEYWDREVPGQTLADCRRHAPAPIGEFRSTQFLWPMTRVDDWCGEVRPRLPVELETQLEDAQREATHVSEC